MSARMMEPLTLTDARHTATVARWLDQWQDSTPSGARTPLCPLLQVGLTGSGHWYTVTQGPLTYHTDRAALVAYVVAWARNTTNKG